MAPSPLVAATIQSSILSATSNLLAQAITAYRTDRPLVIDWVPVFQFILFTILSTPPNFLWQEFLESTFPSTTPAAPTARAVAAAATGDDDDKALDGQEAREGRLVVEPQGRLHVGHTATKFLLDQTVGAAVNTVLFSTYTHSFQAALVTSTPATTSKGGARRAALDYARVDWRAVAARSRADFWPLMRAALGLWPWVSLFQFTVLKTVAARSLVGALAGMVWGVYMSLFAAQ